MRRHCWGESFFVEPMTMRKTSNSACRSISLVSRSSIGRSDSGLPSFAKQRLDVCIGSIGVNDPHTRPVFKAKALHRPLGFHPLLGGRIGVLQLANHMGGGDPQDIAGIDIENRQPNGIPWA